MNSIALTNKATIDANASGQTLTIDPAPEASVLDGGPSFLNQGTLQASNGGILVLTGNGGGAFSNTGHTIQALDNSEVQLTTGVSIAGGTLTTRGTGVIRVNGSQDVFITNLTNAGAISVNNNSFLHTSGTITNTGAIALNSLGNNTDLHLSADTTLNGGGTVTLAGDAAARISGDSLFRLTNVNNLVQGRGQIGVNTITITSQATIDANVSGQTLTIDPANVANAFVNTGTLEASGGGILVLSGNGGGFFTNTGGLIEALGGSQVQLTAGATITGGTLATIESGAIVINAGQNVYLNSLTNTGAIGLSNNSALHTTGTITNSGSITLNSAGNNTDLTVAANTTLTGGGTVTLTGNNANRITGEGVFNLTNTDNVIQGQGQIGLNQITLTNQSVIDANVNGQTLTLDPTNSGNGFVNTNLMRATNGGILVLSGNGAGGFTNTGGSISALDGSTVRLVSGASITGGFLGGLGSGVVRVTAGEDAFITNLTTLGTIVVDNSAFLHPAGAISNTGTITLNSAGNNTDFHLAADTTLSGNGTLILASNNAARITADTLLRLTNAEATIQGQGQIGVNAITITNQAMIKANVSGQTLTIDPANSTNAFTNEIGGLTQASNGGVLLLSGNGGGDFTNSGTISAVTGGAIQLAGTLNSSGTVDVGSDSLTVTDAGTFNQTAGSFWVAGGTVTSSTALNFLGGLVDARGTINSAITNGANLQPALGGSGLIVNGAVGLLSSSRVTFQLGGLTQGSQYGFLNVNGTVALGGNLVVTFLNSFVASTNNSFTVLSSTSPLAGVFSNAPSGSRIFVSDNSGTFLVTYAGSNSVILSNFLGSTPSALPQGGNVPSVPTAALALPTTSVATSDESRPAVRAGRFSPPRSRAPRLGIALQTSDDLVNLMENAGTAPDGKVTIRPRTPRAPVGKPRSNSPFTVRPKANARISPSRPAILRQPN